MKYTRLEIPEIVLCEPEVHFDNRGYFIEAYRHESLETYLGYPINFCQENETKSSYGVIRGLHYQQAPFGQSKLVRVTHGAVLDVVVDVRKNSRTFGKHISIEISAENKKQLFIPAGFAHGFITLSSEAIFVYKVDIYYNEDSERGISFDDKDLAINWRLNREDFKLSKKDINQTLFKDAEYYKSKQ